MLNLRNVFKVVIVPAGSRAMVRVGLVSEPDPLQYEEGSGHSRASELSPGRNVDLTNQNH